MVRENFYFKNKTLIISNPYTTPKPIADPFNIVIPITANGILSPPYLNYPSLICQSLYAFLKHKFILKCHNDMS